MKKINKTQNYNSKHSLRAFTLVELAVAMLIVGILASISVTEYSKFVARAQVSESFVFLQKIKRELLQHCLEANRVPFNPSEAIPYAQIISGGANRYQFRIDPKSPYYFDYWAYGQFPTYTNGDPEYGGYSVFVVFEDNASVSKYLKGKRYSIATFDGGAHSACSSIPVYDWYGNGPNAMDQWVLPPSCQDQLAQYMEIRSYRRNSNFGS